MTNDPYTGRELGWEDEIEKDNPEFVVLPKGEYAFEVVNFERARHPGSEKLPPCNKAVVHIRIEAPEGTTTIRHNFFLHTITEGMLCAFFTAIGQRQRGERLNMNWNAVIGARGRCKVGVRKWVNEKTGKEMESNEINRFLEPADGVASPASPKYQTGRF